MKIALSQIAFVGFAASGFFAAALEMSSPSQELAPKEGVAGPEEAPGFQSRNDDETASAVLGRPVTGHCKRGTGTHDGCSAWGGAANRLNIRNAFRKAAANLPLAAKRISRYA